MFGISTTEIELSGSGVVSGERDDQLAFEATLDALSQSESTPDRHELPPLEDIPVGPYLATLLEYCDPAQLNGHDIIRLLKARERQSAHTQARAMAEQLKAHTPRPVGGTRMSSGSPSNSNTPLMRSVPPSH